MYEKNLVALKTSEHGEVRADVSSESKHLHLAIGDNAAKLNEQEAFDLAHALIGWASGHTNITEQDPW